MLFFFQLCFAYQGGQIQNTVRLSYTYEDSLEELHNSATNVAVTLDVTPG
jgi:hypothetical protein